MQEKPQQHRNNTGHNTPKPDIPATRLFKVLNPELFMKPNKWIMYGGVVTMVGIMLWLGSSELQHRQDQHIADAVKNAPANSSAQRAPTYQERMAELRRSSS
ncbi:hypothetical protein BX070DRAFT_249499 [Coemansia spiralis]|nr:hypothetical protein BX070DRAFT_249499 [Coemansia spiralis]